MAYHAPLRFVSAPIVLSLTLLLAACSGGSGGSGTTPLPTVTKRVLVVGTYSDCAPSDVNCTLPPLVAFLKAEGYSPVGVDAATFSLTDAATLKQYDFIFFLSQLSPVLPECDNISCAHLPRVVTVLQSYISGGGRVFFADWAAEYLEQAFPTHVHFYGSSNIPQSIPDSLAGVAGAVVGIVRDTRTVSAVGKGSVVLNLEPGWSVMLDAPDAIVVVEGEGFFLPPQATTPVSLVVPLVVRFDFGNGQVVFSSAGASLTPPSDDMKALIRALIIQ